MPKTTLKHTSVRSNDCIINYPDALCRKHMSKGNSSAFRSISFPFNGSWASFAISEDAVSQSVRRNGEIIPNRLTLNLGSSEDVRFVSIRADDNTFTRKPFFNRTIKSLIDDEKKAYLRSIAI